MKPAFVISSLTARIIKQTSLVWRISCKWLTRWSMKDNEKLPFFYWVNYLKNTKILLTYLSSRRTSRKTKIGRNMFEIQQFKWPEPTFCHYLCRWPCPQLSGCQHGGRDAQHYMREGKKFKAPTRVTPLFRFWFCASVNIDNFILSRF